jgi:hypothetical protein
MTIQLVSKQGGVRSRVLLIPMLQGNSITNQSIHHDMDGMECEWERLSCPLTGRVPVGSLAALTLTLTMGRVWSLHFVSR